MKKCLSVFLGLLIVSSGCSYLPKSRRVKEAERHEMATARAQFVAETEDQVASYENAIVEIRIDSRSLSSAKRKVYEGHIAQLSELTQSVRTSVFRLKQAPLESWTTERTQVEATVKTLEEYRTSTGAATP